MSGFGRKELWNKAGVSTQQTIPWMHNFLLSLRARWIRLAAGGLSKFIVICLIGLFSTVFVAAVVVILLGQNIHISIHHNFSSSCAVPFLIHQSTLQLGNEQGFLEHHFSFSWGNHSRIKWNGNYPNYINLLNRMRQIIWIFNWDSLAILCGYLRVLRTWGKEYFMEWGK